MFGTTEVLAPDRGCFSNQLMKNQEELELWAKILQLSKLITQLLLFNVFYTLESIKPHGVPYGTFSNRFIIDLWKLAALNSNL